MTALNKQALREAAIRAGGGNWIYIRTLSLSNAYITEETGATVINCTAGDVPAKCDGFLELANPATVLALLDEIEKLEKVAEARKQALLRAHKMFQRQRDRAVAAEKRIAELEARDINIKRQVQALFEAIANPNDCYIPAYVRCLREALNGNSTGIGVKGE